MDSWIPWTITRNFIRAFCPTLIVAISWDLRHNLNHAMSIRQLAVTADAIALSVVLAVRLSPPWAGAREQLKYLFGKSWIVWLVCGFLLLDFLLPVKGSASESLLGLLGCVFYADLSRVCKTDVEENLQSIRWAYGFIAWVSSGAVAQIRDGTFLWRDVLILLVFFLVVITILALKWWGQGNGPMPYIQELNLNGKDVAVGAISKSV